MTKTRFILDLSDEDIDFGEAPRFAKSEFPSLIRLNMDAKSGAADLYIYGEIGSWWGDGPDTAQTVKDLATLDSETLNVRINSPGGAVFDGVAIYNALASFKGHVNVIVEGVAASIASVIAMAGDTIKIGESANMMIHKPWSIALGDANAMRKEADVLDNLEGGILDIYAARTGRTLAELKDLVSAETWFRGADAVAAGFADEVIPAKTRKAQAARSNAYARFHNTPADLFSGVGDEPQVRSFEKMLRSAGLSASDSKLVASLAVKEFAREREVPAIAPRDEDAQTVDEAALWQLANHIRKHSL